jgi:hypothetical protein
LQLRQRLPTLGAIGWLDSYRTYMPYGVAITAAGLITIYIRHAAG